MPANAGIQTPTRRSGLGLTEIDRLGPGLRRGDVLTLFVLSMFASSALAAPLNPPASREIRDRNGIVLREVLSANDALSNPVRLEDVSPWAVLATLAAEDRRFYSHGGVDLQAVLRALWQNARAGRTVSGGSTLTQQLVRCLEPAPRTFLQKLKEGWKAVFLERRLEKREILESYLNTAPYGHRTQGIDAASRLYFGVPAGGLSLAQAALLAGVPNSPARFDPLKHLAAARRRQRVVLDRMKAWGWLDDVAYQCAIGEPFAPTAKRERPLAPHFAEFVRERSFGARVDTTLDAKLQSELEPLLAEHLKDLEPNHVTNGALVALDNATGEVLAWVGSADFLDRGRQGEVDGVVALRQPGSALKPFAYGLALSKGWKTSDILEDMPTFAAGGFTPKNYDQNYHGLVRLREALACSYNIPAVRLAERVGVRPILDVLRAFGFDSLDKPANYYGLGLVLGNGEVSLLELANAYATLARGGVWLPARTLLSEAPAANSRARRALDRESAYLITNILADNAARAEAFGLNSPLAMPFPFAAKTGTTKDYRDNWAVGFTPGWTVAVWVGNFDGKPMRRVSGISGAAPILHDAAMRLYDRFGARPFAVPSGIATVEICPLSGELPGPWCPDRMEDVFSKKRLPTKLCSRHRAPEPNPPATSLRALIEFPKPGDVFKVDPAAARDSQVLVLRSGGEAGANARWKVDRAELVSRPDGSAFWPLRPGRHTVELTFQDGTKIWRSPQVRFLVLP